MAKLCENGICTPKGFQASGIHCGIRKNRTKKDLALIYSEVRRGIRPSMYALSTVIFVVVLVVLLIANFRKQPEKD